LDAFDTQISQAITTVGLTEFPKDLRQPKYFQIFSDVIFGSVNNDTLNDGVGNDLINGGAGTM
jgi:RTX calcium-binding nonapeptide repeat (4 copies)